MQQVATQPPLKTAIEDIDALAAYLRTQVGWVSIETIKKAIPSRHADNRKIETMRYIGLLDRDGSNVKLSADGRDYASASPDDRVKIVRKRLHLTQLYKDTLTWLHFNKKDSVNKADIGNYWHDKHEDLLAGAAGAALTDATVVFMRFVDAAGLGRFVAAGVGRDTHLEVDAAALAEFVTGEQPELESKAGETSQGPTTPPPAPPPPPLPAPGAATLGAGLASGLHVNVEIHIAADAKPATIEEIFKNMRKYLLDDQNPPVNGG
jgi:hypothetical protein